jgi:hypothetical protein
VPYREPARRPTRYLRLCLDVLTAPTPCAVPWDTMDAGLRDPCTRVCQHCRQEVHDVAEMDAVAAESFLAEHVTETHPRGRRARLRLRLHRRPDGRVMARECARGAGERRQRRIAIGIALLAAVSTAVMINRFF